MLIPIALLLIRPVDGIQRFHDFVNKNKSFSVQISARSNIIPTPGKGSYIVNRPNSFRVSIDWGAADYNYVKDASGAVEFERYRKTYQEYPGSQGIFYDESTFAPIQAESMPIPLLNGDLKMFLAPRSTYKLVKQQGGNQTYTATWSIDGGNGKVTAVIGADGRLIHFEVYANNQMGVMHRVMDFSNYVFNPKTNPYTFIPVPPLGFTIYQFPTTYPEVQIGHTLQLGTWKSAAGSKNIDADVRGKLMVIREPSSPPADALIAYLDKQNLPVKTVVVSVGESGGQFWAPAPAIASKLSSFGTPFSILLDAQGKVTAMWLGFNPDRPEQLVAEITKAAKGTSGE